MNTKVIAIIPARMESVRLPNKPLLLLEGKSIISHVHDRVSESGLFTETIVATDSSDIANCIIRSGGKAVMTPATCKSGTDRVMVVANEIDCDVVVNVQGDEPFITKEALAALKQAFTDDQTVVASLMHRVVSQQELENPNVVKVVVDFDSYALYFSRSTIPYNRDNTDHLVYHKHIGVYGFRREHLLMFSKLRPGILENLEKLEQLRWLENGHKIKMIETTYDGFGIDTKEDYEKAKQLLKREK
jgi:3-deoxy-manno-octulosonate cytidylyltransferase (CMP-KDO synthetase)